MSPIRNIPRLIDAQGRILGRISIVDAGLGLLLLLLLGPTVHFASEIRFSAPRISDVEPMETIISPDQNVPLVVRGKWFDSECVTRLGDIPLITKAANTQRLDLMIPTQKIRPGAHTLTVTNRRGLSAKWKKQVMLLTVPPVIKEVHRLPSKNENEIGIILLGKNFDKGSNVRIQHLILKVTSISPTRIEAWGDWRSEIPPGQYPVCVTNDYGQTCQLENAVWLTPLPSSSPQPVRQPAAPAPSTQVLTNYVPIRVVCVFQESETRMKKTRLKRGASVLDAQNQTIAKVQKVFRWSPFEKTDKHWVLATLVLACERDPSDQGLFRYGRGMRGYPLEGEPLRIGTVLAFVFPHLSIQGTVLTDPFPWGEK